MQNEGATGFADPKIIENGADQVKLFYLADENRVWFPADVTIDGDKVVLTSPKVKTPRGVSYGTGGIGFQPNLYNQQLLPMTPFIYYDNELVTSETWPDEKLKIDGEVIDPSTVGIVYEWRKMPLLSTQFRDNAVLQAGKPITFWGSVLHDFQTEAEGEAVVKFSFSGIEKTIPVSADSPEIVDIGPGNARSPNCKEWRVTVPAMEASAEPKTLKVTFLIDGEVAHERVCENIVIGDVWFVAAPQLDLQLQETKPADGGIVRVMKRKAKRSAHPAPSRYTVAVSRTPLNRFASTWDDSGTDSLAGVLGHRLAAKSGNPVGVIYMENVVPKDGGNPQLKSWIPAADLKRAPSLKADYEDLAAVQPGTAFYDAGVKRYLASWENYWGDFIPQMIETSAVPYGEAWGSYPQLASDIRSDASQTYNVLVHSFTPTALKGVVFLSSPEMVEADQGANFGEQLQALAESWTERFGGEPSVVYTIPNKNLAPKITAPTNGVGVEIDDWAEIESVVNAVVGP